RGCSASDGIAGDHLRCRHRFHQTSMRRLLHSFLILISFAGLAGSANAQDILPATEYVDWTVQAVPSAVAPGSAFELRIQATIEDGWKMYALDSPRPSFGVQFSWDEM